MLKGNDVRNMTFRFAAFGVNIEQLSWNGIIECDDEEQKRCRSQVLTSCGEKPTQESTHEGKQRDCGHLVSTNLDFCTGALPAGVEGIQRMSLSEYEKASQQIFYLIKQHIFLHGFSDFDPSPTHPTRRQGGTTRTLPVDMFQMQAPLFPNFSH